MDRAVVACGLAAAAVLLAPAPARAQEPESPTQQRSNGPATTPDAEREELERDVAEELGAPPEAPAAPGSDARPGAGDEPDTAAAGQGGNPLARLLLLPDISAVFSGALSYQDFDVETEAPRSGPYGDAEKLNPIFEELELALQAVVDPYARADVFISFTPDEVGVEEAYLTALTLPYGLSARAGVIFSPFGRINQQHPHAWDFADRPLANARLLGPEALGGAGVVAAWLAPLPWFAELYVGYQALRPGLDEEADPGRGGVARLVQYVDLAPGATLGVGVSGALVQEPVDGWRDLAGADVYLKLRPQAARSYVALQGEAIWSRLRDVPEADDDDRWGAYAQAVRRQGPRWAYGIRYDRAPGVVEGAFSGVEHRVSGVVSWLPSEFQQLRLQGGWTRLPGGGDGWEGILALEFGIGAHGAHAF
jgi:hypothetical protein